MADLTKYLLHHNDRLYEGIIVSFTGKGPKEISISELKEYPYALRWDDNNSFIQSKYESIRTNYRTFYTLLPGHKVNFSLYSLQNMTILFIKEI